MISFADMMKKQIVMPAHLMNDGQHTSENGRNLFKDFSSVAQTTKTYTGQVGATATRGQCSVWTRMHCKHSPRLTAQEQWAPRQENEDCNRAAQSSCQASQDLCSI